MYVFMYLSLYMFGFPSADVRFQLVNVYREQSTHVPSLPLTYGGQGIAPLQLIMAGYNNSFPVQVEDLLSMSGDSSKHIYAEAAACVG